MSVTGMPLLLSASDVMVIMVLTMLTGMQQGYQGQGGYTQYQDQYARGTPGSMGQEFNQQYPPSTTYPPNRPMYPPYGPEGER